MNIVILAGYMLNSRDSKKSSISWMEMGRNSCRILCMAAIKQESVFDEEKILIPYKIVGYEYLFYSNRKSFLRYIDEDVAKEPCIMEVRQIGYFCMSS